MRVLVRIFVWLYAQSLKIYPSSFRDEYGEEMEMVFTMSVLSAMQNGCQSFILYFWRELKDWPASVFREHLKAKRGKSTNPDHLAWRPLNVKELLTGLALFVLPTISPFLKLIFGYKPVINNIVYIFTLTILIIVLIIIVLGIKNGFPRWSIPYFGVAITTIIMLQVVYPLWALFVDNVRMMINYSTRTLAARIQYSVLLSSFFWLVSFMGLTLLILLLMVWPRTRKLAQRIRQDWTLISFMVYSALVFDLELIFEEYAYDEAWKIASRICLVVGAWIYFKNANQRKRILALLAGATLFFGIAAVGQWVVLPLQSWGDFYGYDHWTYRRVMLSGTLTGWVSALLFMLIPALINLIPRLRKADSIPEETLTPA